MNKFLNYGIQALFVCGIALGSQTFSSEDKRSWLNVARYVMYLITIKSMPHVCNLVQKSRLTGQVDLRKALENHKAYAIAFTSSVAVLLYFRENLFREDFVYVGLAYLLVRYPEVASKSSINYGVGMACSFFEGYLVHVIPSDGAKFVGFEENIRALENDQGICFPVKKLFLVITKDLFCPPDLKQFNKGTDVPYLEAFNSLEDIIKDVAGVRNRTYRNTAYKVYRPGGPPVCLAAECATPLHTLHRVLNNRTLYQEVADIDVAGVVEDFCTTLQSILDKSPQCRGKCELVYYNNEDPSQNLAEILLERLRLLAPHLDSQIEARRNDNIIENVL